MRDVGSFAQNGTDHLALHSNPTPVNDSQRSQSKAMRFFQVTFHGCSGIARRKSVEIEHVGDRELNRIAVCHS
jgi:hypothetical protein